MLISLMNILCIACDKGFFGVNCDIKCRLPWYGQDCQSLCWCKPKYCDHVNGCMQSSIGTIFYIPNEAFERTILFKLNTCVFHII